MTTRRARSGTVARAELWFAIFIACGTARSLTIALERGAKVVPKPHPSLTTLKRWSVAYRWQERAAELDAEVTRARTGEQVRAVQRMNQDQAAIGAMGVQLAAFGLERLMRQVRMAEPCAKCGIAPLDLDADDVSRLMDTFGKWQRLALGEATDRTEIAITIWNIIIMEITQLFLAVNIYEDADQRKREYTMGVDEVVGRHLAALAGKG